MLTTHRSRFWLALLGGAVGAVVAAAELSAVEKMSPVAIALWPVAGAGSIAVALWEHRGVHLRRGGDRG